VPQKIAEKTKPLYFDNGKLSILASTFQWANELYLNRISLIEKINKNLGVDLVKELDVTQGSIERSYFSDSSNSGPVKYKLTAREEEEITNQLNKYAPDFRVIARKMLVFYYIQRKKK